MLFLACAAELVVLAERPDVVADDVLLAVMLVEVGVGGAVADVVLDQDAGAALVGVDRQRARVVVVDVVHQIVAQHRPRRIAQAVDAAHVAEHAAADVVDVVELDHVVMGAGRGIAPTPADRDAGVVQVADLVVRDPVVAGPADPDAHRAGIDLAAVVDQVVVDGIALGGLGLGPRVALLAETHAAGSQVVNLVACDPVVLAAEPQPDAVGSQVRQFAALDRAVPRPDGLDRSGKVAGGLPGGVSLRRNLPVGVQQPQVLEPQVGHELAFRGLAVQDDQLLGDGGDDGRLRQVLAGQGDIRQQAGLAVQVPLAGRIQGLGHVLDKVADVAAPVVERPRQRDSGR